MNELAPDQALDESTTAASPQEAPSYEQPPNRASCPLDE